MKMTFCLAFFAVMLGSGCEKKSEPSTEGSSGGNIVSAPTEYLGSAANARHSMVKSIDTVAINNALNAFAGEEGRYPTDLNELVTKKYLREIPAVPVGSKIEYDANAGTVKVVKQ